MGDRFSRYGIDALKNFMSGAIESYDFAAKHEQRNADTLRLAS